MYDFNDLLQVALMSMVKAHRAYETDKSLFSTFATVCMRNDLIKFINKNRSLKSRETPLYDSVSEKLWFNNEESSEELVPDNLTDKESGVFYYKKRNYKDKEIREILDLNRLDYRKVVNSLFKKIVDSNE